MYQVNFTKFALLENKEKGNVPQGIGVAYMDCNLDEIEGKLNKYMGHEDMFAVVENVGKIKGVIVR